MRKNASMSSVPGELASSGLAAAIEGVEETEPGSSVGELLDIRGSVCKALVAVRYLEDEDKRLSEFPDLQEPPRPRDVVER